LTETRYLVKIEGAISEVNISEYCQFSIVRYSKTTLKSTIGMIWMSVTDDNFLDRVAFEKLKKQIWEAVGINCNGYRPEYLKRRLAIRLKATDSKTYFDYERYLKKNPKEADMLLNDLTVNYSLFFRDPDVFQFLRQNLFPQMLSSFQNIRIWSAGCAAGEEPYSIAILAEEYRISCRKDFHYTIYASDVDRDALAKASKGQYDARSFEGTDKSLIGRYFIQENGSFKVKDSLKQCVRFELHDLMTAPLHQNLDLVLCRNVMIYFSRESQQSIHMRFHDSLREGGYLVIGKTEMLSSELNKKFICVDPKTRMYRKTEETVGFKKPEATIVLDSHGTNLRNMTNKPLPT